MKNRGLSVCAMICCAAAGWLLAVPPRAGADAKKPRVKMTVKVESERNRDFGDDTVEAGAALKETTFKRETAVYSLNVSVKNQGKEKLQGEAVWCFIGQSLSEMRAGNNVSRLEEHGETVPAVFCGGRRKIVIPARESFRETLVSKPFVHEQNTQVTVRSNGTTATQREYERGDAYKGYLVLFVVDGAVTAAVSNSSRYRKEEWVKQCLEYRTPSRKKERSSRRK